MVQVGIRKAIVLAGGRGERLQPVVPDLPKPMAPVRGRPFLEFILDRLVDAGLTEVTISVGYKAEVIEEHFGQAYRSLPIRYSRESYPLGTGGAMALALKGDESSPALVLNADTLVDIDYQALMAWYAQTPTQVAIVLRHVPDVSRYGAVVLLGERVQEFQEKGQEGPGLVNAGVYLVKPEIFSQYGRGEHFSFEADILQPYCRELQPRAFVTTGYFIDIGTPSDYERAQREVIFTRVS
ncbi:nucleotidyltransferase family protein [Nitrospira sp. T9]|uniref:nucleotidyltransferase family protein n=1 Tax=unclassified Nitrospira TaxID=2652172 RepID=UPI003F9B2D6B